MFTTKNNLSIVSVFLAKNSWSLKLAIQKNLPEHCKLHTIIFDNGTDLQGKLVTQPQLLISIMINDRDHFEAVFHLQQYQNPHHLLSAINLFIAVANSCSTYPDLCLNGATSYLQDILAINYPFYTRHPAPLTGLTRFFDTKTWTLDTRKYQSALQENFKKALQEDAAGIPLNSLHMRDLIKSKTVVDLANLPAKISAPIVLDETMLRQHQVNTRIIAPHHPGFDHAVFISGSDPALGAWEQAHRCQYDKHKHYWYFDVPVQTNQNEYKFLTGKFHQGAVVMTDQLHWENGANRKMEWMDTTSAVIPRLVRGIQ